jgi:hypothetical protein
MLASIGPRPSIESELRTSTWTFSVDLAFIGTAPGRSSCQGKRIVRGPLPQDGNLAATPVYSTNTHSCVPALQERNTSGRMVFQGSDVRLYLS